MTEDEIHVAETCKAQELIKRGFSPEQATKWTQVGIAYEDQQGLLLRDAVRFSDGALGTYIRFVRRVEIGPGVVVLPIYQEQVLLIRCFHYTTRTWHLRVPFASGVEGLSTENSVRRMLKEIEATITSLTCLGQTNSVSVMADNRTQFFCAQIESYGPVNTRQQFAELLQVTIPEFERLMRENEITDGFTLVAYTLTKLQGLL